MSLSIRPNTFPRQWAISEPSMMPVEFTLGKVIDSNLRFWNYCGVLGKQLLPLGLLEPQHVAPLATVYLHGPGNG